MARDIAISQQRADGMAAMFGSNRTAALNGEDWMDHGIVGQALAVGLARPTPDGTPIIMANGEPGVYHAAKRPDRNDRRRRRGGFRFTPEPVKGWKQSSSPGFWQVDKRALEMKAQPLDDAEADEAS